MRAFRIAIKSLVSAVLIGTGTVLLVLPGPGIPLIVAGVALLATEFEWAAKLQSRAVAAWRRIRQRPPLGNV
jgi:hypothetical protein